MLVRARSFAFYRRVSGRMPENGPCTSQVELSEDRRRLYLRPASVLTFAVALDADTTDALIDALREAKPLAVRVPHEEGKLALRLSAQPHAGRMGITVTTPTDGIDVVFTTAQRDELIDYLAEGRTQLSVR